MAAEFSVVIPARYAATRLPGKPLRQICGKPMIEWVYRAALEAEPAEVVIATDDQRIADAVEGFGGQHCLTSAAHRSGTDRIVEVVRRLGWSKQTIIVNLQGDEPLMPPENIRQVANDLAARDCAIATLYKTIDAQRAQDPNQVKLVQDDSGYALYFSRAPIPFERAGGHAEYRGHIGIYAYRAGYIESFSELPPSRLEQAESLEQLRALSHGHRIYCALAAAQPGPGIDTEDDLLRAQQIMQSMPA